MYNDSAEAQWQQINESSNITWHENYRVLIKKKYNMNTPSASLLFHICGLYAILTFLQLFLKTSHC